MHGAGDPLPHVTVYGTAVTQVVPDQMVWRLTIQNKGVALSSVAEGQTNSVEQVLAFLKHAGMRDADVQTADMVFGENWEYRNSSRVREGYFASTAVAFRTPNLNTYKTLWLGLAAIPDVSVEGVTYDHSKCIEFQNETRRKALRKAKEKAADLAKTLDRNWANRWQLRNRLTSRGWRRRTPALTTTIARRIGCRRDLRRPGARPDSDTHEREGFVPPGESEELSTEVGTAPTEPD